MKLFNKTICSSLLLLLIVAYVTACRIDYVGGEKPNTNILETTLHFGKSDMEEVMQVLGEPNGKGGMMLPIDSTGRTIWTYYYEKGSVEINDVGHISADSHRTFLFVYFDRSNKYDGYMWFSSFQHSLAL